MMQANQVDQVPSTSADSICSEMLPDVLHRWRNYLDADYAFLMNAASGVVEFDSYMDGIDFHQMRAAVIPLSKDVVVRGCGGTFHNDTISAEGIRSYIGYPVYVDHEFSKVLGFANFRVREGGFDRTDASFVDVCANWLSARLSKTTLPEFLDAEVIRVMLGAIGDALISVDMEMKVVFMNHAAEVLTGYSQKFATGRSIDQVFQIASGPNLSASDYIKRALETGRAVGLSERNVLTSEHGAESLVDGRVMPIVGFGNVVKSAVVVFRDVSETQDLENRLNWSVGHDVLTGTLNRAEMGRRIDSLLDNRKTRSRQNSLLHVGVDRFQLINDTCGTAGGDALLCTLAEMIRSKIRADDLIARVGADEFVVLLEGCNIEAATRVANNIRMAMPDLFSWGDKPMQATTSIGVVPISLMVDDSEVLFGQSSAALAMAKEKGRNRIWVHQADDADLAKRSHEMQWVGQIASAIENNRLVLYHQKISPVIEEQGEPHIELLMRMKDENDKLIPPMAFIPTAERFGLMYALDRWVIKEAFRLMPNFDPRAVVAINLSAQSLCADDLLEYVVTMVKKMRVDPVRICFEITETAAIANLERAKDFMSKTRAMGFRFALDDFGAGFNSFSNLKCLEVDYIKIDGSFVKNLARDRVDYTMVEAINRVGRAMNIQTIAEFVEDQQTIDILRLIGVNFAQGYHIHKPEPVEKR